MPISNANLKWYLSGGGANSDPNASIGGARSSTLASTDLFDTVTGDESAAGDTEYRLVYFRNEDSDSDGLITPVVWILSNTPSADTTIAIGLAAAGKNATETAVANENTAPGGGVSFSSPASKAAGLALTSAPYAQNDYIGVWVRRTVTAGAASAASDPCTLRVEGDTI
jgi:hypothetical protein